ncbi:hypothetical protein C8J37_1433, partial [Rhizobium sp. PP-WC-1G-195]
MFIDKELADTTIPGPYVGEQSLKIVNSVFGQAFCAI